jgi:hypothetical protein
MSSPSGKRKLLFVVSNDYGELSTALDFIAGQPFEALILVPDRLFRANDGDLPAACRTWRSVADVLSAARGQSPDVVFLLSAYLYGVNGLLSIDDVQRLIEGLETVTNLVVTSDPFLGQLFHLDNSTFSDQHPARRQLLEHFARLVPILDRVKHLYRVKTRLGTTAGSVSFYSPAVVLDETERAGRIQKAREIFGILPDLKRWLFVISAEDYGAGVAQWGRAGFDNLLARRLRETAEARRQPILIGPPPCIEALRRGTSNPASALLLDFCNYVTFRSLLCEAEYCFHWNIFSDSIIARVMNRQPVFFFDQGHLVRAMPSFLDAGIKHFYAGHAPPCLDQNAPLSANQFAALAADEDRELHRARHNFEQSPQPNDLVEQMLAATRSRAPVA